jgi:hypothetical protein
MEARVWNTTVTQLVHDFRDAIVALGPIMDRQELPWVDTAQGEPYDDYDDLEESLFRVFVLSPIRHALNDWDFKCHRLRFGRVDYAGLSYVGLESQVGASNQPSLVFAGFETASRLRETIYAHQVDGEMKAIGSVQMPLDGAVLSFRLAGSDGSYTEYRELQVPQ